MSEVRSADLLARRVARHHAAARAALLRLLPKTRDDYRDAYVSDPLIDAANAISGNSPNVRRFALLAAQRIMALEQTTQPPPSAPTWAQIVGGMVRPPFTPARTVNVASQSQLTSAVANLRAGDLVRAPSPFTVTGEFVIGDKQLAAPAVLDFGPVKFTGSASRDELPAVWLTNCKNLRLYGGDVTNPVGGTGALVYNCASVSWWGFLIHDTAADSLGVLPVNAGTVTGCDFYGEVCRWGRDPSLDPHQEKGTGIHGCQFSDSSGNVTNTRLTLYAHDGPTGAAVQYGSPAGSTTGNTLRVKAERLTKVSTSQVAGNGLNLWGGGPISATVEYLEVNDAQGYAVSVDHEYGIDFSRVNVLYGRAHNTQMNPKWSQGPTFQAGPTYRDVKVV